MDQQLNPTGLEAKTEKVSLETLSKLTGFPVEMIKDEVFNGEMGDVSLDELRSAMLSYIDSSMMLVSEENN